MTVTWLTFFPLHLCASWCEICYCYLVQMLNEPRVDPLLPWRFKDTRETLLPWPPHQRISDEICKADLDDFQHYCRKCKGQMQSALPRESANHWWDEVRCMGVCWRRTRIPRSVCYMGSIWTIPILRAERRQVCNQTALFHQMDNRSNYPTTPLSVSGKPWQPLPHPPILPTGNIIFLAVPVSLCI